MLDNMFRHIIGGYNELFLKMQCRLVEIVIANLSPSSSSSGAELALFLADPTSRAGKKGAARQQCFQKEIDRTISGRRILVNYIILSNSTPTCKPNSTSVGLSRS